MLSEIIPKPPWFTCFMTAASEDSPSRLTTINDGRSMIDIIPLSMALELIQRGIIPRLKKEHHPFKVIFGKEGATSTINFFIHGAGLLEKVYVSPDIRVALISDISFTDKGITIIKTSTMVVGIDNKGTIVFKGLRDTSQSDKTL